MGSIFVKLTPKQIEVRNKMKRDKWYSAYDLHTSISTLNALHKKGVIDKKCEVGYFYSPRTCIVFKRI